ncbi:MAG: hypothetical protein LBT29_03380 [Flavobacteriaceae bacterium]|jgi:hypothetical protein|nr:hypothetical protein [Flavobacteriaceae bacterium]
MIHLIENVGAFFSARKKFIPTEFKIRYINQLMEVGYFAINIGKFDSQHFQFSDLEEVIKGIERKNSTRIFIETTDYQRLDNILQNEKISFTEISFSFFEKINFPSFPEKIVVNFDGEACFSNLEKCGQKSIKWLKFHQRNVGFSEKFVKQFKNQFPEIKIITNFYNPDFQFFETNIKGYAGGISTEKMLTYLVAQKQKTQIQTLALESACNMARKIFSEF